MVAFTQTTNPRAGLTRSSLSLSLSHTHTKRPFLEAFKPLLGNVPLIPAKRSVDASMRKTEVGDPLNDYGLMRLGTVAGMWKAQARVRAGPPITLPFLVLTSPKDTHVSSRGSRGLFDLAPAADKVSVRAKERLERLSVCETERARGQRGKGGGGGRGEAPNERSLMVPQILPPKPNPAPNISREADLTEQRIRPSPQLPSLSFLVSITPALHVCFLAWTFQTLCLMKGMGHSLLYEPPGCENVVRIATNWILERTGREPAHAPDEACVDVVRVRGGEGDALAAKK